MIDQNENELLCTQMPYNLRRLIRKLHGFKRELSGIALQDMGNTRSFMKPLTDAGFRVFLATMTINPHCADPKTDSEFQKARFLAQFLKHLDTQPKKPSPQLGKIIHRVVAKQRTPS